MNYQKFLDKKSQSSSLGGFKPNWMPDFLFDFQKHLVEWSIRKGRAAIFADCGLGKTPTFLTWAENVVRETNKNVLIMAPLAVSQQTVREGEKFGIEVGVSRDGKPAGKISVINYERLHKADRRDYIGAVCDESSILKHWSGKTQKSVTRFLAKIPYRLLCTATPAPNDFVELGTSSEALGELTHSAMLETFFRQISDDEKKKKATADDIIHSKRLSWRVIQSMGQWALKAHAFEPFWKWVSGWARGCRKPSDLGPYDDSRFVLPPLKRIDHVVTPRKPPDGYLFTIPAFGLNQERSERRRTIEERSELVGQLVQHNDPAVIWCSLNDEADAIADSIPDAVQVKGSQSLEQKEELLISFLDGESRVLVTKAKIAGLGLNMQHCNHVVTFVDHCYSEDTEILTGRGWMRFNELEFADDVATCNPETLAFEWQRPTGIIWQHYSGPMIQFGAKGKHAASFDLLVTPNHRMFTRHCPIRFPSSDETWRVKTASELQNEYKRQKFRMLSVPQSFSGIEIETVEIPPYVSKIKQPQMALNRAGNRRGLNQASSRISVSDKQVSQLTADQFLRLAGWFLSEGYCGCRRGRYDGQITITQTDINPEHRREIIALLESIDGMNVYSKTKDIRFCSKQLASFLIDNFGNGSYEKRIPPWVKDLAVSHLTLLRDTMLKGDGCSNERGGIKRFYRTASKQLADDFAEICIKTGVRASVHYRENAEVWDVMIARQNIEPSIYTRPQTVEYAGMVGCVSVPNGLVIVRRNGIPIVSGNSYEKFYQSVRRCWRFGQEREVRLDVIATEGEINVKKNMDRKEQLAAQMFESIVAFMNESHEVTSKPHIKMRRPKWLCSINDSPTITQSTTATVAK